MSLFLQVNKTTCHSFMDAGRRLKILGSETKDLLPIEVAETRKSAFFLGQFSKPSSHGTTERRSGGTHTVGCIIGEGP